MVRYAMIIGDFYLRKYGYYHIKFFLAVTTYYTGDILDELKAIGCPKVNLETAYDNLSSGDLDIGLTYVNSKKREGIMVIAKASSGEQFANSLAHESGHLAAYIGRDLGFDPYGEEQAYLLGEIAQRLHRFTHRLSCEKCRTLITRRWL